MLKTKMWVCWSLPRVCWERWIFAIVYAFAIAKCYYSLCLLIANLVTKVCSLVSSATFSNKSEHAANCEACSAWRSGISSVVTCGGMELFDHSVETAV